MDVDSIRPGTLLHASYALGIWSMPPDRADSADGSLRRTFMRGKLLVVSVRRQAFDGAYCGLVLVLSSSGCGWMLLSPDSDHDAWIRKVS